LKLQSGHPVLHFDRIDSTNAEARRRADEGERGPLWIVADEQTGGRGRMGRHWVSPPGNLHATFLFAIAAGPDVAAQVSFVAALAVHDTVTALRPELEPRIKWPNDVLIGGAKFCGVLPEVVGTSPTRIAIGCGINVAHAPQDTPYPVTFLNSPLPTRGRSYAVESVLQELDSNLSNRLKIWDEGRGFGAIREAWGQRALGLAGDVTARVAGEDIAGVFTGLAKDGALILTRADGTATHIHSGEVKFAELERLRQMRR
jgi:BirA family transcriptional regulator, biotin operon repressor / biotin---[acetyl-CoA-carboxylase] ligase